MWPSGRFRSITSIKCFSWNILSLNFWYLRFISSEKGRVLSSIPGKERNKTLKSHAIFVSIFPYYLVGEKKRDRKITSIIKALLCAWCFAYIIIWKHWNYWGLYPVNEVVSCHFIDEQIRLGQFACTKNWEACYWWRWLDQPHSLGWDLGMHILGKDTGDSDACGPWASLS